MEREQLNDFLQKVPDNKISSLQKKIEETATVQLIQKPTAQTLLIPVKDPINNGTFYSGEVLVTTSIVQVNDCNGWAMIMDDNPEKSLSIAVLDGAFAADICKSEIILLAQLGEQEQLVEGKQFNKQINSTRVSFDLL